MDAGRILVVEDDPDINALLARVATREGFEVVSAFSGTEALLRMERAPFDLVLLDMMLPGMDGPAIIGRMREAGARTPVVVVSAKAGASDKVAALKLGADDYVTKPFDPDEVAARIHAVLRRAQGAPATLGADVGDEVLSHRGLRGVEVALTVREFDILHVLMRAPDRVFSRERLYELVWRCGYYGEENAVNVHVSNIRKKLSAAGAQDEYVKTVWGIGFKLA